MPQRIYVVVLQEDSWDAESDNTMVTIEPVDLVAHITELLSSRPLNPYSITIQGWLSGADSVDCVIDISQQSLESSKPDTWRSWGVLPDLMRWVINTLEEAGLITKE